MYYGGEFRNGEQLFTDDQIFPNPEKPNSLRKVRMADWCRWDQIPDPVRRKMEADAARAAAATAARAEEDAPEETVEDEVDLSLFSVPGTSQSTTYPAI
jgi:hypothetical protein